ncbi:unnamed protein product [Candidula unifasciata]|uniref:DEP domain-containing protein n=1 Tax=Candidula unifasciata TaxID=100452 RepID=A0A8S3ZAW6_9EUPU|nr:unnamed protein product [Candidula unifasciata]
MTDSALLGPYRATRLWNDVVLAFRQYLPCGRHRRYMKTFDNCFSGASATEWLLQYLKTNGNFGLDISREKATSLLNKLYRAGIFEEVRVSKTMHHKQEVRENRLYKFSPISPSKMKITRLPLAPRNDLGINRPLPKFKSSQSKEDTHVPSKQKAESELDVPNRKQSKLIRKISLKRDKKETVDKDDEENYTQCHLVARVLTTKEIKDTWKAAFILRCKQVLGVANLGDVISTDLVDGYNVMHNCIYLNKSGVVTNIDTKEQLPHWVLSAMKCLARWPEPPEPGLPNYPGFEKDVFGVVKDYFLGQDQPLIPYSLYDTVTNVFVMAGNSQLRHSSPRSYNESGIPSTLWSSVSLENIILNLTKKYCLLDNTGNQHGSTRDLQDSTSWFGTREDLRFAEYDNHNSGNCHQSAILHSKRMDMLGQNHTEENAVSVEQSYGLTAQESCKSASISQHNSGSIPLFTTTQSATEASQLSDHWLSGINRKYGSVPNLKVSRYETAFGPDNKTVTRVFYQNGMTTDYGHDEEESSFLKDKNNTDKAKSAVCLYDDRQLEKDSSFTEKPVARSKSFVNVNKCMRSESDEHARVPHKNCYARSLSFNGNNGFGLKQNQNNHSSPGNYNRVESEAERRPCSSSQQSENHDSSYQQAVNLVDIDHIEVASSVQNTSAFVIMSASTAQDKHPSESQTSASHSEVSISQCQSHSSQTRTSVASSSSYPIVNEGIHPSPTKQPAVAYDLERNCGAFSEDHFPSSKATKSPFSLPTLDRCQSQKLLYDHVPSVIGSIYCQDDRSFHQKQETEYSVVLDASKKKSAVSRTNLVSKNSSQSCINLASPHNVLSHNEVQTAIEVANRMTSTPYLPQCDDTTAAKEGFISSLSLSRITPFYSRNSHSHRRDNQHSFISYPQTRLAEDRAKNSLQMITLLLPPANRRKLHFLFKMMMKMTLNPNLCLDPSQTTRSLVIGTFYPAIIRSPERCELDEVVQLQLVSFMLDCYDDIFTPPSGIKTQVSDRLKALQRPQVVYSPKPERTVRFCQQTSVTDFENQRISTSHTALETLLEDIISNQDMNIKEKTKRLKQFQRMYPTIYHKRFPDAESEAKVLMVKVKQPLMTRPLNKLKGLRL